MFNLDESVLMSKELFEIPCITIAYQVLTIILNKLYGYYIPSIQGLVSFNSKIDLKISFTPLNLKFEDLCLKNVNLQSSPKLFDSLVFSCNEIYKFRKDIIRNELFKNAQSRIIVISSGIDNGSEIDLVNLVK